MVINPKSYIAVQIGKIALGIGVAGMFTAATVKEAQKHKKNKKSDLKQLIALDVLYSIVSVVLIESSIKNIQWVNQFTTKIK